MKTIFVVALAFWAASEANAQQINQEGCAFAADVAVTSRALSAAGVERALAEQILLSIYTGPDPLAQKIRLRVTDAAYMSDLSPKDYAEKMFAACMRAEGWVDRFLGLSL